MVFVFFGLVACVGTAWTQAASAPWWLWTSASALGLLSIALLMANNIRDIPTDRATGKRTLAVRLGDPASRWVYAVCAVAPVPAMGALSTGLGLAWQSTAALVAACCAWSFLVIAPVATGAAGRALIPVLRSTGLYTLSWALLAAIALLGAR